MVRKGATAEGGSQETPAGSRASRGLPGGHKKTGEDSPVLEMVEQKGFEPAATASGLPGTGRKFG
jgi:hypothetical protein